MAPQNAAAHDSDYVSLQDALSAANERINDVIATREAYSDPEQYEAVLEDAQNAKAELLMSASFEDIGTLGVEAVGGVLTEIFGEDHVGEIISDISSRLSTEPDTPFSDMVIEKLAGYVDGFGDSIAKNAASVISKLDASDNDGIDKAMYGVRAAAKADSAGLCASLAYVVDYIKDVVNMPDGESRDNILAEQKENLQQIADGINPFEDAEQIEQRKEDAAPSKADVGDLAQTLMDKVSDRDDAKFSAAPTKSDTVEHPQEPKEDISKREDARVLADYKVAETAYEHRADYPTIDNDKFKETLDKQYARVVDAADRGGELCKDYVAARNELDSAKQEVLELNQQYGDSDKTDADKEQFLHKSEQIEKEKIPQLEGAVHDIELRAGAIVEGTKSASADRESSAILNYCRADDRVRDAEAYSPDGYADNELYLDRFELRDELIRFRDMDPTGISANLLKDIESLEKADKKLSEFKAEAETEARPKEEIEKDISDYSAQREVIQERIDEYRTAAQLGVDGVQKYGVIETPADTVAKDDPRGKDIETGGPQQVTQVDKDEKAYEAAKAKYEDSKDKYLFRNTFVLLDRLELNIAAYNAGRPGDRGQAVSGGDIAMNVIELLRSNLWDSVIEIGVRAIFDKIYPADAKVDKPAPTGPTEHVERIDYGEVSSDIPGIFKDNGDIEKSSRRDGVTPPASDNPGVGRFWGADLTREPLDKFRDPSMAVHNCGKGTVDTYRSASGIEEIKIPPLRLVEFEGYKYLVDPFGQTLKSDVITDAPADRYDAITRPPFESLDISANGKSAQIVAEAAASKGMTLEEYKDRISTFSKEAYIDRTAHFIDKHSDYLEKKLIPSMKTELESVTKAVDSIRDAKADALGRLSKIDINEPGNMFDATQLTREIKQFDLQSEKLQTMRDSIEARLERVNSTVTLYKETLQYFRTDVSLDSKLSQAVEAETKAHGKIDSPSYGVDGTDVKSIQATLSYIGADFRDFRDSFDARWERVAGAKIDTAGVLYVENNKMPHEQQSMKDWLVDTFGTDKAAVLAPNLFVEQPPDLNADISKEEIEDILRENGIDTSSPESDTTNEGKDAAGVSSVSPENHESHADVPEKEDTDTGTDKDERRDVDSYGHHDVLTTPTDDEIKAAKDYIAAHPYAASADDAGIRWVNDDTENHFDPDTMRKDEIIVAGNGDYHYNGEVYSSYEELRAVICEELGVDVDTKPSDVSQEDAVKIDAAPQASADMGPDGKQDAVIEKAAFAAEPAVVEPMGKRDIESAPKQADIDNTKQFIATHADPASIDEAGVRHMIDIERPGFDLTAMDPIQKGEIFINQQGDIISNGKSISYEELRSEIRTDVGLAADKAEIAGAVDRYLDIASDPSNTFDLQHDFIEPNLERIDPSDMADVFSEKLENFKASFADGKMDAASTERLADAMSGLRSVIRDSFDDKTADTVDKAIERAAAGDSNADGAVSTFLDKLDNALETVKSGIEPISTQEAARIEAVADKLNDISRDTDAEPADRIKAIAEALDSVFSGYSEMLHDVARAYQNSDLDAGITKEDLKANAVSVGDQVENAVDEDGDKMTAEEKAEKDGLLDVAYVSDSMEQLLDALKDVLAPSREDTLEGILEQREDERDSADNDQNDSCDATVDQDFDGDASDWRQDDTFEDQGVEEYPYDDFENPQDPADYDSSDFDDDYWDF